MIIKFANYLFKTENSGYFSPFLTKNTACTILLDPYFKFQFLLPAYLIHPALQLDTVE